jgi:uncharacterized membrane protein (UPF0127 family)
MTSVTALLRRSVLLLTVLTLLGAGTCQAQEIDEGHLLDLDAFPKAKLDIQGSKDTHHFDIWIAETPRQQQQGLMFVRDLPAARGMLFVAKEPRVFDMWMRNTYIPLDMVFIGADGRISTIAENTTPHSLAIVSSKVPVGAILELKAGEAARRALHAGDKVSWTRSQ